MVKESVYNEFVPLREDQIVHKYDKKDAVLDYPMHVHPVYEITLVKSDFCRRIVGDSLTSFEGVDLVFVGPGLSHSWYTPGNKPIDYTIVVQFDQNFLPEDFLNKTEMSRIRGLLDKSSRGICFTGESRQKLIKLLKGFVSSGGFDSVVELFTILNEMSKSKEYEFICSSNYSRSTNLADCQVVNEVYRMILENYTQKLSLNDVAEKANMSPSAFSHYFKKRVNRSFSDVVIELRTGHAAKLLIETSKNIADVCYESGFNNMANFNKLFKRRYNLTPREYRRNIA